MAPTWLGRRPPSRDSNDGPRADDAGGAPDLDVAGGQDRADARAQVTNKGRAPDKDAALVPSPARRGSMRRVIS